MNKTWWKESVVYQIYPRSFADSNGDGIGDIQGIIQKLDYLANLGIDVVWLSPVYQSPNDDNGYDISDYQQIMHEFGDMHDWELMLAGMHARGIKLVMDLVVNHTSDEHAWFVESRSSKENPYRDYYIWRPDKDGREPNNWSSFFSGSAWKVDEATGEYFLHLFSRKQPDLNWENPQVRAEIFSMMTWWLDKGVDGFRMDVINMISKAPGLPDGPQSPASRYGDGSQYYFFGPRLMEFLGEMKAKVLSRYDILTVGETPGASTFQAAQITDETSGPLNMLFQFDHMGLDELPGQGKWALKPLELSALKQVMSRWQTGLEERGWNSLYLSNHDQPRAVSRFGDDGVYRVQSAKMLGTFLHMQKGTPYVYQGEEIGMTNVRFDSIADYNDLETLNWYDEFVHERDGDPQVAMRSIYAKGRDNARTPMQWDSSPNAGFTTGKPWLKLNPNYVDINVRQALDDRNSVFYYYQKLIRLRKQHAVMVYGKYELILAEHAQIYAFTRTLGSERWLVMLNFSAGSPLFTLPPEILFRRHSLIIANYPVDEDAPIDKVVLQPYEARVYRLQGSAG